MNLFAELFPTDDELGQISASEADKIAESFTSSLPHLIQVMTVSGSYTLVGSSYIMFLLIGKVFYFLNLVGKLQ